MLYIYYFIIENKKIKNENKNPLSPCCAAFLVFHSWVPRVFISDDENNTKDYVLIRKLICSECGKFHNEIPTIFYPFKRHLVATIEKAIIASSKLDFPPCCPISTVYKLKKWFLGVKDLIINSLASLKAKSSSSARDSLPSTENIPGQGTGWLANLVIDLINHNYWAVIRKPI
jgi:hypothetical protein